MMSGLRLALCVGMLLGSASAQPGTASNPTPISPTCGSATSAAPTSGTLSETTASLFFAINVTRQTCAAGGYPAELLDVYMTRTGDAGDPDLYVSRCHANGTNWTLASCTEVARDLTTQHEHRVSETMELWTAGEQSKLFLVEDRMFGTLNTTFSMVAIAGHCPSTLDWSTLSVTQCNNHGTCAVGQRSSCQCNTPYVLQDCSGLQVSPPLTIGAPRQVQIPANSAYFFSFDVPNSTLELILDVGVSSGPAVSPTLHIGGPDGPLKWLPSSQTATSEQIRLTRAELSDYGNYTLQLLYSNSSAGVHDPPSAVTIELIEHICPFNCNGNGDCNASTHTCACHTGWAGEHCQLRQEVATADRLEYKLDGSSYLVAGSGLEQEFTVAAGDVMIFEIDVGQVTLGSEFDVQATTAAPGQPTGFGWCPSSPAVNVTRSPPGEAPEPQYNCQSHQTVAKSTMCAAEFGAGKNSTGGNLWYVSVQANGFSNLTFKLAATVRENSMTAQVGQTQSELATAKAHESELESELSKCNAEHNPVSTSEGVSGGIAALLFFIGAGVGAAAGWAVTRFWCFKGVKFEGIAGLSVSEAFGYAPATTKKDANLLSPTSDTAASTPTNSIL